VTLSWPVIAIVRSSASLVRFVGSLRLFASFVRSFVRLFHSFVRCFAVSLFFGVALRLYSEDNRLFTAPRESSNGAKSGALFALELHLSASPTACWFELLIDHSVLRGSSLNVMLVMAARRRRSVARVAEEGENSKEGIVSFSPFSILTGGGAQWVCDFLSHCGARRASAA